MLPQHVCARVSMYARTYIQRHICLYAHMCGAHLYAFAWCLCQLDENLCVKANKKKKAKQKKWKNWTNMKFKVLSRSAESRSVAAAFSSASALPLCQKINFRWQTIVSRERWPKASRVERGARGAWVWVSADNASGVALRSKRSTRDAYWYCCQDSYASLHSHTYPPTHTHIHTYIQSYKFKLLQAHFTFASLLLLAVLSLILWPGKHFVASSPAYCQPTNAIKRFMLPPFALKNCPRMHFPTILSISATFHFIPYFCQLFRFWIEHNFASSW